MKAWGMSVNKKESRDARHEAQDGRKDYEAPELVNLSTAETALGAKGFLGTEGTTKAPS